MYCSMCGTHVTETMKFCPNCGTKIAVSTPAPEAPRKRIRPGVNKKLLITGICVLICAVIIGFILLSIKSPEELLTDGQWYSEINVHCKYYDWSSIDCGSGYWINANCRKVQFYTYGEAETTSYQIGNNYGSYYGPFSYEINSENIPPHVEWAKDVWDNNEQWKVLDENTLKYDGNYFLWDDKKDTHCNCEDYDCKHNKTWYVTPDYLRIGRTTYTSKKPYCLNVDD